MKLAAKRTHMAIVWSMVLILALAVVSATGLAGSVAPQNGNAVVPEDVTVDDDYFAARNTVTLLGRITGDTFAAGEDVKVAGKLDGDLFAVGQNVDVGDTVAGSLRLAGQSAQVRGSVGRNAAMAGNQVTFLPGSTVAGNVLAAGNNVKVDGKVGGVFRAGGNNVAIGGEIGRNVEVSANTLVILSGAKIEGDVICRSQNPPQVQPGAQVNGTVRHIPTVPAPQVQPTAVDLFWSWLSRLVALLVIAAVAVLFMPRALPRAAEVLRTKPWASLGWGALGFFAPLPVVILLFATIIGRSLGWALLFSYVSFLAAGLIFAKVIPGLLLGTLVLKRVFHLQRFHAVWAVLLGALILELLTIIPSVGWLVQLGLVWLTIGALLYLAALSWFAREPKPTSEEIEPPPDPTGV